MESKQQKLKLFFISLLSLFAFASCGKNLKPDAVISATEANRPTAEFYACGQHFVGLGICSIGSGVELSQLAISIQTYYQGSVRIVSTCKPDSSLPDTFSYLGNTPLCLS